MILILDVARRYIVSKLTYALSFFCRRTIRKRHHKEKTVYKDCNHRQRKDLDDVSLSKEMLMAGYSVRYVKPKVT